MKKIYLTLGITCLLLSFINCTNIKEEAKGNSSGNSFSFAFLTDVHMNLNNINISSKGLRQALADAKSKGVDFIVFGGDIVDLDGLQPKDSLIADSLINVFKAIVDESGLSSFFTIGNHDRYYTFNNEPDKAGFSLFNEYFGETYYSFDHKGVHFIVLNSVQINDSANNYNVGPEQVEWLKSDLSSLVPQIPVVVFTHVPFQSLYYPAVEGVVKDVDMFSNFKEVWDILLEYDLKVILQGHQHLHEELLVNGTHFVTGGAVSAAWWSGPLLNTEEGYMLINVDNEIEFTWEYIDYGWEVE